MNDRTGSRYCTVRRVSLVFTFLQLVYAVGRERYLPAWLLETFLDRL